MIYTVGRINLIYTGASESTLLPPQKVNFSKIYRQAKSRDKYITYLCHVAHHENLNSAPVTISTSAENQGQSAQMLKPVKG